ncbi:hypothetical protein NHX12_011593, partial [Muraenolepis orangiensis]
TADGDSIDEVSSHPDEELRSLSPSPPAGSGSPPLHLCLGAAWRSPHGREERQEREVTAQRSSIIRLHVSLMQANCATH